MTPQQRNASRATARVTRCKARPSPSSASPHVPRGSSSSPSGAQPWSSLIRVARLVTPSLLPGSDIDPCSPSRPAPLAGGPEPTQFLVPCERAGVTGPRPPAFFVGAPGPAPGSHWQLRVHPLALAAPSPSVSPACAGGLRPGPACGAGPLIRRFEAAGARQLPGPVWRRPPLAAHRPRPSAFRPAGRRAACAGQPARKCRSRWLAGPAGASQAVSRASRQQ